MSDKNVVVITGAGSGLGRALSKKFLDEQWFVIGVGRTENTLAETFEGYEKNSYISCTVDVTNEVAIDNLKSNIETKCGKVDLLINNAAVYPKINLLDDALTGFKQAMEINVLGIVNLSKIMLPLVLKSSSGRIINVGSWAHLGPIPDSAAYSVSKGAVHSLTKALAADIADKFSDKNLSLIEWIPGHLNTQMSEYTGIDPSVSAVWCFDIAQLPVGQGVLAEIYERDAKWLPPVGLKTKILRKLGLR